MNLSPHVRKYSQLATSSRPLSLSTITPASQINKPVLVCVTQRIRYVHTLYTDISMYLFYCPPTPLAT